MTKQEFESLAMRNNGTISCMLYDTIERFYMSDNEYHEKHGGIYENKRDFVKRVFGGKVNTPNTILKKIIAESQRENRWCLQGMQSVTKDRLDDMDCMIAEHLTYLSKHDYF